MKIKNHWFLKNNLFNKNEEHFLKNKNEKNRMINNKNTRSWADKLGFKSHLNF